MRGVTGSLVAPQEMQHSLEEETFTSKEDWIGEGLTLVQEREGAEEMGSGDKVKENARCGKRCDSQTEYGSS